MSLSSLLFGTTSMLPVTGSLSLELCGSLLSKNALLADRLLNWRRDKDKLYDKEVSSGLDHLASFLESVDSKEEAASYLRLLRVVLDACQETDAVSSHVAKIVPRLLASAFRIAKKKDSTPAEAMAFCLSLLSTLASHVVTQTLFMASSGTARSICVDVLVMLLLQPQEEEEEEDEAQQHHHSSSNNNNKLPSLITSCSNLLALVFSLMNPTAWAAEWLAFSQECASMMQTHLGVGVHMQLEHSGSSSSSKKSTSGGGGGGKKVASSSTLAATQQATTTAANTTTASLLASSLNKFIKTQSGCQKSLATQRCFACFCSILQHMLARGCSGNDLALDLSSLLPLAMTTLSLSFEISVLEPSVSRNPRTTTYDSKLHNPINQTNQARSLLANNNTKSRKKQTNHIHTSASFKMRAMSLLPTFALLHLV